MHQDAPTVTSAPMIRLPTMDCLSVEQPKMVKLVTNAKLSRIVKVFAASTASNCQEPQEDAPAIPTQMRVVQKAWFVLMILHLPMDYPSVKNLVTVKLETSARRTPTVIASTAFPAS